MSVETTTSFAAMYDDMAVFQRTKAGQREVTASSRKLSPEARRFLVLVNGYTSLRTFLELGFPAEHAREVIAPLMQQGLIELVPPQERERRWAPFE